MVRFGQIEICFLQHKQFFKCAPTLVLHIILPHLILKNLMSLIRHLAHLLPNHSFSLKQLVQLFSSFLISFPAVLYSDTLLFQHFYILTKTYSKIFFRQFFTPTFQYSNIPMVFFGLLPYSQVFQDCLSVD